MNYYIIAAGGTGAMCVRSFIYLAAAGCAKDADIYHILLIDKDKESDAVTACENLLEEYNVMYDQLRSQNYSFPRITLHKWNFTQQIIDEYQKNTGKTAADLSTLTLKKLLNPDDDPNIARMLDTMYSQAEQETDLKNGFYGHPNIGAPVFDYVRDRFLAPETNEFMSGLRGDLAGGKTYVYLFGSLFGGTGATVIPNVVLALRSITDNGGKFLGKTNLILGGAMLMPYFKLPQMKPDSLDALEKLVPTDTKFADQTREALDYYETSNLLKEMMNLTLIGSSQLDVTSEIFARGGVQAQHFHMVLMLAAVAANRFFDNRLGSMADAINAAAVNAADVNPLGELILWKFTPEDPGNNGVYSTLTSTELGLMHEYDQMMGFLRFSVVVAFFMQQKFQKDWSSLRDSVEVQGTVRQMSRIVHRKLDPKNLTETDIDECYKLPVQKADAICRGFIKYFLDVALSGYDWTQYYDYYPDKAGAVTVDGHTYYPYVRGAVSANAQNTFSTRWVDLANLDALMKLLLTDNLATVTSTMTLNGICSFNLLDADRPNGKRVETNFPNSIATVYYDTLHSLGLERNLFGRLRRIDVDFSEIYAVLRQKCKKG